MKHYLLIYDYADDYAERRAPLRSQHLHLAWQASDRGELILGGALNDPLDTGLLLFTGETPDAAKAFVLTDPYVLNGLVKAWRIREWITVAGELAASPLRA